MDLQSIPLHNHPTQPDEPSPPLQHHQTGSDQPPPQNHPDSEPDLRTHVFQNQPVGLVQSSPSLQNSSPHFPNHPTEPSQPLTRDPSDRVEESAQRASMQSALPVFNYSARSNICDQDSSSQTGSDQSSPFVQHHVTGSDNSPLQNQPRGPDPQSHVFQNQPVELVQSSPSLQNSSSHFPNHPTEPAHPLKKDPSDQVDEESAQSGPTRSALSASNVSSNSCDQDSSSRTESDQPPPVQHHTTESDHSPLQNHPGGRNPQSHAFQNHPTGFDEPSPSHQPSPSPQNHSAGPSQDSNSDDVLSVTNQSCCSGIQSNFVDAKTFANPSSLYGPRVHRSLVHQDGNHDYTDVEELIKVHKEAGGRAGVRQMLLAKMFPYLMSLHDQGTQKFQDIARFVIAEETELDVRKAAVSCLERSLLGLQYSGDLSATEELLSVSRSTQAAFLNLSNSFENFPILGSLHLMAVAALLSRCQRPEQGLTLPPQKQKENNSAKHVILGALQVFYKDIFNDKGKFILKSSCIRVWANEGQHWDRNAQEKRKKDFSSAKFWKHVVFAFTLLGEVMHCGWDVTGKKLLGILKELYEGVSSSRLSKEAKATFNFFLVRGLVILLTSTFEEAYPDVGGQHHDHTEVIADLIKSIMKDSNQGLGIHLLQELEGLPFHSCKYVREVIHTVLKPREQSLTNLAVGHVQSSLQQIGFQRGNRIPSLADKDECKWITFSGQFGQRRVEVALYRRKADCIVDLERCIKNHPGAEDKPESKERIKKHDDANWHEKNMETLTELGEGSKHVIQLLVYQYKPLPFYITECVEEQRLLWRLLDHRKAERWLSTQTFICIALDLLQALIFLTELGIVVSDITTYNIIVQSKSTQEAGSSQKWRFVLSSGRFIIKLASLGTAHRFQNGKGQRGMNQIHPVRDAGLCPVRWLAPEAFEGSLSPLSMVYAFGCVMYEVTTHGCQPFTSYDMTMNTEAILHQMLMQPGSIRLNEWPCISEPFRTLIRRCTDPSLEERPLLEEIQKELEEAHKHLEPDSLLDPGLRKALTWKNRYPRPSQDQESRNHRPQMGIPESIQRLTQAGRKSADYINMSNAHWSTKENKVKMNEISPPDWILIEHRPDCIPTLVRESVSPSFVHDVLPSISAANDLPGITCWLTKKEERVHENWHDVREYMPSKDLKTAASRKYLWPAPYVNEVWNHCDPPYLIVFMSVAQHLAVLHERGFLLRDLRAAYVLVSCEDGQVFLARIGRMCQIPENEDFVEGDVHDDSLRRLAPEVWVSGQYNRANDVFMMVTMFWEVFWIRQEIEKDPLADDKHFVPFANLSKVEVLEQLQKHTDLPRPDDLPNYLHDLIQKGRHPDPNKRPTAHEVLMVLQGHAKAGYGPKPFFPDHSNCPSECSDLYTGTRCYLFPPPRVPLGQTVTKTKMHESYMEETEVKKPLPRQPRKPGHSDYRRQSVCEETERKQLVGTSDSSSVTTEDTGADTCPYDYPQDSALYTEFGCQSVSETCDNDTRSGSCVIPRTSNEPDPCEPGHRTERAVSEQPALTGSKESEHTAVSKSQTTQPSRIPRLRRKKKLYGSAGVPEDSVSDMSMFDGYLTPTFDETQPLPDTELSQDPAALFAGRSSFLHPSSGRYSGTGFQRTQRSLTQVHKNQSRGVKNKQRAAANSIQSSTEMFRDRGDRSTDGVHIISTPGSEATKFYKKGPNNKTEKAKSALQLANRPLPEPPP